MSTLQAVLRHEEASIRELETLLRVYSGDFTLFSASVSPLFSLLSRLLRCCVVRLVVSRKLMSRAEKGRKETFLLL